MARPKIQIDPKEVYKLAQIGCRIGEIADFLGCSHDVIERRFASELDKGRSELKMSLRRWQLQAAQKGQVAMLIWLGKQMLGQQDHTVLTLTKIPDEVLAEEVKKRLEDANK